MARRKQLEALFLPLLLLAAVPAARADEGGVSFWLPGQFGSLAAVPGAPGWSLPMVYIHESVSGGGGKEFPRGGRIVAGLDSRVDLVLLVPSYTFPQPVAGGQAALAMGIGGGHMRTSIDATLTGPLGNSTSGSQTDTLDGAADLYPQGSLKWNNGVHNTMAYVMGGVPVGSYAKGRLSNIGTNHWSLDGGGGYTYLDPKAGREFSAVAGLTYNFENPDTNYRNGIDGHVDWAASQFFTKTVHAGLVGYFYQQLSGDSGSGATLGDFKSRVAAIGPQVGWFFDGGGKKYYANAKAFWEFGEKNRAAGWNLWLSLVVPLSSK
ncbi:phenol degradation protein [Ramlibacter sp. G-1-2-2]|uniref:Phenol degradation protein n=1 Tax=Ramlibacter agri TaxID=2728837 RepID=A0A848GZZ6_9BURK|nr:transporter [Ramlibacter agri]NML44276.1 phenol degradation protein [Ramlibacter agri]